MKSVYEASTSLDAHMILNLLAQEGIQGRVDGEYLPGGVGELQAINLVRVMVDEADYERATQIINDWEAIEVEKEQSTKNNASNRTSVFLIGAVIGGGLVYWAYNSPLTEDAIDMNGDPRSRATIQLTPVEREFVLSEMRVFLESTQKIVNGITAGDMELVAEGARTSGRAAQTGMPGSLAGKLPSAFRQMGSDTHRRFDELALDAEQLGDEDHALSQLGSLLGNCVSCHSAFRIGGQLPPLP